MHEVHELHCMLNHGRKLRQPRVVYIRRHSEILVQQFIVSSLLLEQTGQRSAATENAIMIMGKESAATRRMALIADE